MRIHCLSLSGIGSVLLLAHLAVGQDASIEIHADRVTHQISPFMTGACIEDVNHEVYGGIYSQMIFGESFQESPGKQTPGVSGMWRPIRRGSADGAFATETAHPFIGHQSQQITFLKGEGEIGVENRSLNRWGMNFVSGKPYDGLIWARAEQTLPLRVAMESGDGSKTYAEATVTVKSGDWQRIAFSLTPNSSDTAGRFAILLKEPGSITVGYAFLQPGSWGRFKELPLRKDVVEGLIAEGLTVLRYGGSMVNSEEYRWKKMIGPRDRRPPYKGTWYAYSSNGWGIIDFLSLCEAAGFLAVPDLNVNETPQDIADFIEYVNGPPDSAWGRRRVEDGHPAPFHLKYIELGNEEKVDESYWKKFKPLAEAIWSKDQSVTPVVADFDYHQHITDPNNIHGGHVPSLAAHKKILDFAQSMHHPVYFDVHIWNDRPRDPELPIDVLADFIHWLGQISPNASFKVCVFEENALNHAMRRALGHANAVNRLMRLGDHVPIVCAANCLQCDGENDNGWDQGLLFLSPSKVWPQPPYYVTRMISQFDLTQLVEAAVSSPGGALDGVARTSGNGHALALQIVNLENHSIAAQIHLHSFAAPPAASVTQLAGHLDDVNTAADPVHINPKKWEWDTPFREESERFTFPPESFTVIRWEAKDR